MNFNETSYNILHSNVDTKFKHGGAKPTTSQELTGSDPDAEETTLVLTLGGLHVKQKSYLRTGPKSSRRPYDPDRWDTVSLI